MLLDRKLGMLLGRALVMLVGKAVGSVVGKDVVAASDGELVVAAADGNADEFAVGKGEGDSVKIVGLIVGANGALVGLSVVTGVGL